MPMSYLTPGVYVEEVSGGPRPIEAVGTSTAGFVGGAPRADAHLGEAYPVNNWSEFLREFSIENGPGTHSADADPNTTIIDAFTARLVDDSWVFVDLERMA